MPSMELAGSGGIRESRRGRWQSGPQGQGRGGVEKREAHYHGALVSLSGMTDPLVAASFLIAPRQELAFHGGLWHAPPALAVHYLQEGSCSAHKPTGSRDTEALTADLIALQAPVE